LRVVALPPNDAEAVEKAFIKHGSQVAGFWAEPVMMNREAIALDGSYLKLAEQWCRKTGALLCIDEIQTGFWQPEVFAYRNLGIHPDLVITGKGMTAGFHPLSAVIMKHRHDVLQQYDAISTNGSASLPSFVALCSMELIQCHAERIRAASQAIQTGFQSLTSEFPGQILSAQGRGYLSGLKFRRVDEAIRFHRQALEAGLWTRVHAYHEGHSTLLTKLGLLANRDIIHFLMEQFRALLQKSCV
jgi:acetylornithine/succinyldiaminopimelate/putrescine aminotransferase